MKSIYLSLFVLLFGALTACEDEPETPSLINTNANLTATINGAQQVPVNPSTATGSFTGTYTASSRQLAYTVTYTGITPSNAHIHTGTPGNNGSVAIPFASLASPITGTVTLTDEQAQNLLSNGMYVNIHSTNSPNGEIRGNITKR
ncbi:CHRD domain-containing protein [Hymenobacter sp. BT175]|uniref:CHRD domain-containing protein n=1 Tax=Hymenobacter translucens TaxID=2886507 RepID=UPI001D0EACBC|nr:CHRD domain-containing protein [Hymenobacter translucens]MCC2548088.1 CHRD domain-containing protein [Hymenobacter translucens]